MLDVANKLEGDEKLLFEAYRKLSDYRHLCQKLGAQVSKKETTEVIQKITEAYPHFPALTMMR